VWTLNEEKKSEQ